MIRADDLRRNYGATVAVDGISFEISPREVVGFLGPNGAGKTTTLKVLTGFLHPTSGKVEIAGMDVAERPLDCRASIGYLPENNPLYEELDVAEYLEWAATVRSVPREKRQAAVKRAIDRCGLGEAVAKEIGTLSKGFRQRVGLAQAILHDPPILLLDEPTSGLDPNQAAEVRKLISELRQEKTVLLSSHILSEVKASCDRVIIIHRGRIAAQGRPDELAAQAAGGAQRLRLVLRRGADAKSVKAELTKLPGVVSAEHTADDGEEVFTVSANADTDLRSPVFEKASAMRWPLLELHRESASLEEVFRSLTA